MLTSADKGVYPIQLEMNGPAAITYEGYLVYNDDVCVLITYSSEDAQALGIIDITMPASGSDIKWEKVNESLSILELRSELFDTANGGSGGGSGGGSSGGTSGIFLDLTDINLENVGNHTYECDFSSENDLSRLEPLKDLYDFDESNRTTCIKNQPLPTITIKDNSGGGNSACDFISFAPYVLNNALLECKKTYTIMNGNERTDYLSYNTYYNKSGQIVIEAIFRRTYIIH